MLSDHLTAIPKYVTNNNISAVMQVTYTYNRVILMEKKT